MNWNKDIQKLELFFSTCRLPQSVKLDNWITIIDVNKFLISHFGVVKRNNGNSTYLPYLERLKTLKQKLS